MTNPVLLTPPKLAPPLVRPASPSSPQSGEEGDKEFDRGDGDNYIDLDHPEGRRRREAARARRAEASDKHLSDLRRAHPGGIPGPSAVDKARARALRLSQC